MLLWLLFGISFGCINNGTTCHTICFPVATLTETKSASCNVMTVTVSSTIVRASTITSVFPVTTLLTLSSSTETLNSTSSLVSTSSQSPTLTSTVTVSETVSSSFSTSEPSTSLLEEELPFVFFPILPPPGEETTTELVESESTLEGTLQETLPPVSSDCESPSAVLVA